jgi:plasmid stability protein
VLHFLFMLSLLGNAIALYYAFMQRAARLSFEQRAEAERAILRQALYARGRLTAVEAAARSNISLSVIEATLREMVRENQCLSDLDEHGRAFYVFPQFDDEPQRREATEREILRTAQLHHGELSVEELALSTELTLGEAREWLTALAARGDCIQVNRTGERFRFEGLMRQA